MPTTTQDAKFKAQAIQQRMQLESDLSVFNNSLEELLTIAPPMKLTPTDKKELSRLSETIRNATADNTVRTRVLDLLDKGLGG